MPDDLGRDRLIHVGDRLEHALAAVPRLIAVAQLQRLVDPVEAPDGTFADPVAPPSSATSTSTVGIPARVEDLPRAD